jgi:hypothetical protein
MATPRKTVKNSSVINSNLRRSRKSIVLGPFPNAVNVRLNPKEAAILAHIEAKHNTPLSMKAAVSRVKKLSKTVKDRLKHRIEWLYPEKNFRHFHAERK